MLYWILIIIIIFYYYYNYYHVEHVTFDNGLLRATTVREPELLNEIELRNSFRLLPLGLNIKLDRNNRIESTSFTNPLPEMGETKCFRVKCPISLNDYPCWRCI